MEALLEDHSDADSFLDRSDAVRSGEFVVSEGQLRIIDAMAKSALSSVAVHNCEMSRMLETPQERADYAFGHVVAFDDARLSTIIESWNELTEQSKVSVAKICGAKRERVERSRPIP